MGATMGEIYKELDRAFVDQVGLDVAYCFAAVDALAKIGDSQGALSWLWLDLSRGSI